MRRRHGVCAKQRLETAAAVLLFLAMGLWLTGSTAGCGGGGSAPGGGEAPEVTTVMPGQGVDVEQVDFDFPGGQETGSTWGRLVVDGGTLSELVQDQGGFISVVTAKGWAVVNMPVPPPDQPSHVKFFDLGLSQSTALTETPIEVKHSNVPLRDIRPYLGTTSPFPVTNWVWDARGLGLQAEQAELAPPDDPPFTIMLANIPAFAIFESARYQDVTNVQCAVNQCFPMATANMLQYLDNRGTITIPHPHAMGLGVGTATATNTLVGQLDIHSLRAVTSRTNGSGVWFQPMVDGTFAYLQANGLAGSLTFRHQDVGYGTTLPAGGYASSNEDDPAITWQWIDDRLADDCGVLMVFIAHAVRITGAGRSGGDRWIRYSHDSWQSNDSAGLEDVVTYISDTDGDGLLNMDGSSLELRWVWAACP